MGVSAALWGLFLTCGLFFMCGLVNCTTTRYSTYEEHPPGTEIGNLSRDLRIDPADDPQTSFRFMQETKDPAVEMREADGLLSVGERIDRERLCPPGGSPRCVTAFDVVAFSKGKFHFIHVEVEVKDINDHPPGFPRNETRLEILENAPLFSRFPLEAAVDLDVGQNYIQSYNISPSSHFMVEERLREDGSKCADLVLIRELDREAQDHYTVQVTATDGGVPPRSGAVTVRIQVLDFNDNSPTFDLSSLRVELLEDAPVGHRVLTVRALDPDQGVNGEVTYAFVDGPLSETARVFHLDPHSGDVTLKSLVDFERTRSYEFDISASDSGLNSVPSTCKVAVAVVDVNDNAPEMTVKPMTSTSDGVAYITEAAAMESFVALISTVDRDSGSNGYVRTSLHGHEHFKLQQAYGDAFMIVTAAPLDREKVAEYNLTLVAEDLGSPPFRTSRQYTIRVSDENDNAPHFGRPLYEVSVLENNVPGSYITTVVARDPDLGSNAKVSYKVLDSEVPGGGGPLSSYVSVDPRSGSLYTLRSFDHEVLRQIEFRVQAEDQGSPRRTGATTVRVRVVDQNDNTPVFTSPVLRNHTADVALPVHAPAGHLVLRAQARDPDQGVNGELTYRLVGGGDLSLFAVDRDSGEVVLRRRLQAELGDVLELTLAASDRGRTPRTARATLRLTVCGPEEGEGGALAAALQGLDGSLVVIVMLSAGCALLLVAIVIVVVTFKLNHAERCRSVKGPTLFDARPPPPPADPGVFPGTFPGPRGVSLERASSLEDSDLYEEGSADSETKMVRPSKHRYRPGPAWTGDTYCLEVSALGLADQFSVKDSGKGDSDFTDSDSDISADAGKKSFSTFRPASHAADTQTADWPGTYRTAPGAGHASYTVSFSAAASYSDPRALLHTWMSSGGRRGAVTTQTPSGAMTDHAPGRHIVPALEEATVF